MIHCETKMNNAELTHDCSHWRNCVNFSIPADVYILPFDKHPTCRCEAFKWGKRAFGFPYEDKWDEDTLTSTYFYIIYYLMKGLRTGWIIFGFYKRQNLWLTKTTTAIWIKSYIYCPVIDLLWEARDGVFSHRERTCNHVPGCNASLFVTSSRYVKSYSLNPWQQQYSIVQMRS